MRPNKTAGIQLSRVDALLGVFIVGHTQGNRSLPDGEVRLVDPARIGNGNGLNVKCEAEDNNPDGYLNGF
jgi:hypothetical protein